MTKKQSWQYQTSDKNDQVNLSFQALETDASEDYHSSWFTIQW